MTRYRVPVSDPILEQRDFWAPVEGFRLVSVNGPWLAHPDVTICTFDDDSAPAGLKGKLVEPTLQQDTGTGTVKVIDRRVVSEP